MLDAQVVTWMSELIGVPLETLEIVVNLIGATKSETAQPRN